MFLVVNRRAPGVWNSMTRLCAFLALLSLIAPRVQAAEPLDIRLVSEVASIAPGVPFYVGIAIHHDTGYHTYWKHPGTVGVPTNIQWQGLPPGFTAEPIDWPEPEPVLMFQIKAQGYERDVVLPIRITPPAGLAEGATITLSGKASWMCCNRTCHPGFKDLTLKLPVRSTPAPEWNADWHAKFEAERAIRPVSSQAWTAQATVTDKKIVLTLRPGADAAPVQPQEAARIIYFTEDGLVDSDKPQKVEVTADGSLKLTLVEAEYIVGDRPTKLSGVLLHKAGWERGGKVRCLRIVTPLTSHRGGP